MKVGSKYEDDPRKMANILSQQNKSVFTTPKDIPDVSLKQPQNENSLSEVTITDKDIKEAIDDMAITFQDQTVLRLAFTKNMQISLSTP